MEQQSRPQDDDSPQDLARRAVHRIVSKVLSVPDLDVRSSLFQRGARSLHLAVVRADIIGEFGVDISLGSMYTEPTIAHIADLLQEALLAEEPKPVSPLPPE